MKKALRGALRIVTNYLGCSWAKEQSPEILFQLQMIIGFSTIGMIFLMFNIIIDLLFNNITLMFIPLGFLVSLIAVNVFFFKTRNIKRYIFFCTIIYFAFALSLIFQESRQDSGILLWLFIYPSMVMSIRIKKTGKILSALSIAVIIFFLLDDHLLNILPSSYDFHYSLRFIMVYILLIFFSYLSDIVRGNLEKELRASNAKLSEMAHTDTLTGISNRRGILHKIGHERYRAQRDGTCFSIIMADIDNFKDINDKYGHNCGDYILKELATLIIGSLRKQDIAGRFFKNTEESFYLTGRWGGEEFLILLPNTNQTGAGVVAEKLRAKIQEHFFLFENIKLNITMSFGACECGYDEDIGMYIARADKKLYEAKQKGRNRVYVWIRSDLKREQTAFLS